MMLCLIYQEKLEIQKLLSPVQLAQPNCLTQPNIFTQPEQIYTTPNKFTQTWFAGLRVFPGLIDGNMLESLTFPYHSPLIQERHFITFITK